MLPRYHIFYGFIFSLIIFYTFSEIDLTSAIIIFISSVLIDVDHYLFYAFTKKDLSLKNAISWFNEENKKFLKKPFKERMKLTDQVPCIFHGIEALIILFILATFSEVFLFIAIGFIFHQILDFIFLIYNGFTIKHLGSQTYNILKYKKSH